MKKTNDSVRKLIRMTSKAMSNYGLTFNSGIRSIKEHGFMQETNSSTLSEIDKFNIKRFLEFHNIRGHEAEAMTKRAIAISQESGCDVYEAVQQLVADRQKAINTLRLRAIAAGMDIVKFDKTLPAMTIKSSPKDRVRKPIPEKMLKACKQRRKQRSKKGT